jgi:hypothetical protein
VWYYCQTRTPYCGPFACPGSALTAADGAAAGPPTGHPTGRPGLVTAPQPLDLTDVGTLPGAPPGG